MWTPNADANANRIALLIAFIAIALVALGAPPHP
jgi:hypothetical protein